MEALDRLRYMLAPPLADHWQLLAKAFDLGEASKPTAPIARRLGLPEPVGMHQGKFGKVTITRTRNTHPFNKEKLFHVKGTIKVPGQAGERKVDSRFYTHMGAAMLAHHTQHGDIYRENWFFDHVYGGKPLPTGKPTGKPAAKAPAKSAAQKPASKPAGKAAPTKPAARKAAPKPAARPAGKAPAKKQPAASREKKSTR